MDGTRILIFGGMVEYGKYSNELYEMQVICCFNPHEMIKSILIYECIIRTEFDIKNYSENRQVGGNGKDLNQNHPKMDILHVHDWAIASP